MAEGQRLPSESLKNNQKKRPNSYSEVQRNANAYTSNNN